MSGCPGPTARSGLFYIFVVCEILATHEQVYFNFLAVVQNYYEVRMSMVNFNMEAFLLDTQSQDYAWICFRWTRLWCLNNEQDEGPSHEMGAVPQSSNVLTGPILKSKILATDGQLCCKSDLYILTHNNKSSSQPMGSSFKGGIPHPPTNCCFWVWQCIVHKVAVQPFFLMGRQSKGLD